MSKVFLLFITTLALAFVASCGNEDAGRGSSKMEASPGAKGPGPVGRGGGSGEGSTVGESQNRDTKSGGTTSGSR